MISKEEAKKKIELLVNEFKINFNIVRNYNEEETKRKLIEPFFDALGWDFQSKGKNSEVHYEHTAHKTKSKRVDYIVGKGKGNFLIEAKQVSKKLDGSSKDFIIQANNDAWNKGMFCVITDFEEFQLIKPIKPNKKKPKTCMVPEFYELGYEEYLSKFDLFWDTFSKEAVEKGALDLLLEKEKKKRKFFTIDDDFLSDLEGWRQKLANNIYKNNTELVGTDDEFLGELTQRVLDRIIFTRILEDRGIEPFFIKTLLDNENIYKKLNAYFKQLRPKYNGLIYNEHQIDAIIVEDKTLKNILINICDTDKNEIVYQFDQIPVEILGSIYERFLGKTLNIYPEKKRDCVTLEKTYLTKDTGIYYTPDYVVKYICEITIRKKFSKKTPQQVKDIKIIDTACGSGSFLVGAYACLLNWYENYYNQNPDKAKKDTVEIKEKVREEDGSFSLISQRKLSRKARKTILTQHIYGVDIDHQAVEVTQMSLFLKMLEENYELQMEFGERELILPSLTDNIVCGNTLLDNTATFSREEKKRLKPFNWEDFFPNIIKWEKTVEGERVLADGYGFDIIIGNPPYVKEYTNKQIFHDLQKSYIYKYYEGKMDYWYLFSCQAVNLLKKNGLHSYIATNNWNTSSGASKLRVKLLRETKLISFFDFSDYKVFQNASIQTMVFVLQKKSIKNKYDLKFAKIKNKNVQEILVRNYLTSLEFQSNDHFEAYNSSISPSLIENTFTFNDSIIEKVCLKILNGKKYFLTSKEVAQGIVAPQDFINEKNYQILKNQGINKGDGVFVITDSEKKSLNLSINEAQVIKPYFTTHELCKYMARRKNKLWIIYTDKTIRENIRKFPTIKSHLDKFNKIITSDFKPYGLHRARDEKFFTKKKVISLRKTTYPSFCLVDFPCYVSQTFYSIIPKSLNLKYLTCLLNSYVSYFWLSFKGKKQGSQLQVDKEPLLSIPIAEHANDDIVKTTKLYDEMIASIEDYYASKNDYGKKSAKADVKRIDKKINQFFYEKYGLSKEDIEIIENNLPSYEF